MSRWDIKKVKDVSNLNKKNSLLDYDFKAYKDDSYTLSFKTVVDKDLFNHLLDKSLKKSKLDKNKTVGVNKIVIVDSLYGLINKKLDQVINNVRVEILSDGFDIINREIYEAYLFKDDSDVWCIRLGLRGVYDKL